MWSPKTHLSTDGGFSAICGVPDARYKLTTDRLEEADCAKCLRISQTARYWPIFHKNKTVHFHVGGEADVYCGAVRDIPEPGPINLTDDPQDVTCEACQSLMVEPTEVEPVNACATVSSVGLRIRIEPREVWLENRLHNLVVAIGNCKIEQRPVPREWSQEAHHILQELSSE